MPSEEDGCTVYSGKIYGTAASFTVSADKTVIFQYGNTVYGPYTVKEDPAAIPKDSDLQAQMIGIELRCGGEILLPVSPDRYRAKPPGFSLVYTNSPKITIYFVKRDLPSISAGWGRPSISSMVGAKSAKRPPSLSVWVPSPTSIFNLLNFL